MIPLTPICILLSKISTKNNKTKTQHSKALKSLDLEQVLSFMSADRIFLKFELTPFNFLGHLCKMETATCTIAGTNPLDCALPVYCFYF